MSLASKMAKKKGLRSQSSQTRHGSDFINKAIKHPGALHRDLGVPEGQKIPAGAIAAAAKRKGKVGQRARLAETLAKLRRH